MQAISPLLTPLQRKRELKVLPRGSKVYENRIAKHKQLLKRHFALKTE